MATEQTSPVEGQRERQIESVGCQMRQAARSETDALRFQSAVRYSESDAVC